jgi:hypothetical protein
MRARLAQPTCHVAACRRHRPRRRRRRRRRGLCCCRAGRPAAAAVSAAAVAAPRGRPGPALGRHCPAAAASGPRRRRRRRRGVAAHRQSRVQRLREGAAAEGGEALGKRKSRRSVQAGSNARPQDTRRRLCRRDRRHPWQPALQPQAARTLLAAVLALERCCRPLALLGGAPLALALALRLLPLLLLLAALVLGRRRGRRFDALPLGRAAASPLAGAGLLGGAGPAAACSGGPRLRRRRADTC